MVISQRRVAQYQTYQKKGSFHINNLRVKGTPRTFLDKQAYTFNQEWPRREALLKERHYQRDEKIANLRLRITESSRGSQLV